MARKKIQRTRKHQDVHADMNQIAEVSNNNRVLLDILNVKFGLRC